MSSDGGRWFHAATAAAGDDAAAGETRPLRCSCVAHRGEPHATAHLLLPGGGLRARGAQRFQRSRDGVDVEVQALGERGRQGLVARGVLFGSGRVDLLDRDRNAVLDRLGDLAEELQIALGELRTLSDQRVAWLA